MNTTRNASSALSDDELLRKWEEAGGDFYYPTNYASMETAKLLPFLRSFAARVRADERERHAKELKKFKNIAGCLCAPGCEGRCRICPENTLDEMIRALAIQDGGPVE
jgi:hypothetical protein